MSTKSIVRDTLIAGEPRVQLMPPSVRVQAKNRETRRMLVLLVVLAIVAVGGGMTWAFTRQLDAASALAAAQNRTSELLLEQTKYADAARVAGLVATTEEAQRMLTAGEVDWAAVMADLATYAPADVTFAGAILTAPAPWEPPLVPEGPLRAQRVATVVLTIASPSYANAATFVAAVRLNPTVADVTITASTAEGSGYLTTVSITLNDKVLKTRFDESDDPVETDDDGEAEESDGAQSTPTPTPTPTPTETEGADQ
jgi:hypothetical protein